MGVRGEIFSTTVALQNRTYFFNVKENRLGDLYLNIVESKNRETGGFERQSVILFSADLREFLAGFDEALRVLDKAEREKRKGARPARPPRAFDREPDSGEGSGDGERYRPREGRDDGEGARYKPREGRGDGDSPRYRSREGRGDGPRYRPHEGHGDSDGARFRPRREGGDSRETRRPRGDRPEGGARASFGKRERPSGGYNKRPGREREGYRGDRPRPEGRPGFHEDRDAKFGEKPRRRVVRRRDSDD